MPPPFPLLRPFLLLLLIILLALRLLNLKQDGALPPQHLIVFLLSLWLQCQLLFTQ